MSTVTLPRPPVRARPRTRRSRRAAATWAAGLIAVVGAAHSFDQPHDPEDGAEGRSVHVGQETVLTDVRILPGWTLGPEDDGALEVRGLSARNISTSPVAPRVELVTIARGQVTARTTCSASPLAPGSVTRLVCTSADRYQRRHDRVVVARLP